MSISAARQAEILVEKLAVNIEKIRVTMIELGEFFDRGIGQKYHTVNKDKFPIKRFY